MLDQVSELPTPVRTALERLKTDLATAAADNLAGLVLYGGVARGRYRPGRSDINVVVLLKDASASALAAVAPVLRAASREAAVEPLLLTPGEVAGAATAFPTKFLDIKHHHVVLAGVDPFASLTITNEQVRARVDQELRNLLLRLRGRFVAFAGNDAMLLQALARNVRPFAIQLTALVGLAGRPVPADDRTAAVYEAAASAFGLDRDMLSRLAALRQDGAPQGDVAALYRGMLEAVERAAAVADGMPKAP